MSDTIGTLLDKLVTVDMKLWDSQSEVYEIRRMSYDEFKEKYFGNEEGFKKFYLALNKATDLNYQRNMLIYEIDQEIGRLLGIEYGNHPRKTY